MLRVVGRLQGKCRASIQWGEVVGGKVDEIDERSKMRHDGCWLKRWLKYYQYNHKLKQLLDCWNGGLSSNWALLIFYERKMLRHIYIYIYNLIPWFVEIIARTHRQILVTLQSWPWQPSQSGRWKQDFGPKANFKKQQVKLPDTWLPLARLSLNDA